MRNILYIEDFAAYGRDYVLSVAHELERAVDGIVHLHDKLTEAAVREFEQGDYSTVVSHLPDAAKEPCIADRISHMDRFINSGLHDSAEATELRYGPSVDLLARMRKHRDVPIVVYSGLKAPDRKRLRNAETYDALISKSLCIPPELSNTVGLLLDRYDRLPREAQEMSVRKDGQRVSVATTVRNFNLAIWDNGAIAWLFKILSSLKSYNPTISVSGFPQEPQFTISDISMIDLMAKTFEVFRGCLLGLQMSISADCGENREIAAKLASIAKFVNIRFSRDAGGV